MQTTIICETCKVEKPLGSFHKGHSECRSCKIKDGYKKRREADYLVTKFKECNYCHIVKPIEDFSLCRRRPQSKCKKCINLLIHQKKQTTNHCSDTSDIIEKLEKMQL